MLKQRLITALTLIPLAIYIVVWAPLWLFIAVSYLMVAVACWEWTRLAGWQDAQARSFASLGMVLLILCSGWLRFEILFVLAMLTWLVMAVFIITYPRATQLWSRPVVIFILGVIFLSAFTMNWINLRIDNPLMLLYVLVLVWAADTGAYCTGKTMGKHRLIPQVSPGKTFEGLAGGMLAAIVVSSAFRYWVEDFGYLSWALWWCLAGLTVLISVLGDLLISVFKRQQGVIDSGQLLPGHGGILDRIDSWIAAVTLFGGGISLLHVIRTW